MRCGTQKTSEPVTARYIRVYVNGRENNQGTSDHIVEFEAYGAKDGGAIIRPDRPEEPEKPVLTGVKASVKKADLKVGETTKATAKITPEKAENVTFAWASSDKKVATVDADGNVKAVGKGTAKLTVTATQGSGADAVKVTDTVKVTVTKDGGQTPQEDGKTPPKTGDETAPFFPFVLALAAGAVVMITRKKNG